MALTSELKEQELIDKVNDDISYATDVDGDTYTNAIEYEEMYANYLDETTHPYSSNISIPWPYIIIESYLGKVVQMMANRIPYVHVVEEDDESRPKARMVERDVNMDLYRQQWPLLCYKINKQAFKYGTAWVLETPMGQLRWKGDDCL